MKHDPIEPELVPAIGDSFVKITLIVIALVIGFAFGWCAMSNADDRFGLDTHFNQGGNAGYDQNIVMPLIAPTGAGWIRDDLGGVDIENVAPGVYGGPLWVRARLRWLNLIHPYGLKVVVDVQAGGWPAGFYSSKYDVQAYANECAWLATQLDSNGNPLVDAIEILNEPNNDFRGYENSIGRGAMWLQDLTAFTNAAYDAIKAANPNMIVIGAGVQGQDIITMLNLGVRLNGIVAHPYDQTDAIPEHVFEGSLTKDYRTFVADLRAARPGTPLWFTEQGCDDQHHSSEYNAVVWDARRFLLAAALGVEHTFFFQFVNSSDPQAILSMARNPEQPYYMLRRLMPLINGLPARDKVVTVTNQDANFRAPDFENVVFANPTGYTVAALWFGNQSSDSDVGAPTPSLATVSFRINTTHKYGQSYILDPITGYAETILESNQPNPNNQPQWSGAYMPINHVSISNNPIIIVVR
jgi:hypothetical protein